MNERELHEQLELLNSGISGLLVPERDKQRLQILIEDIEAQLAGEQLPSGSDSLADQVDGLATTFEADHPTMAGVLKNILSTLANMGI